MGKEKGKLSGAGVDNQRRIRGANLATDKKPLDPPAIIELKVDEGQDPNKMFLQSECPPGWLARRKRACR